MMPRAKRQAREPFIVIAAALVGYLIPILILFCERHPGNRDALSMGKT